MILNDLEGHFGDLLAVVTWCAQLTRDLLPIAKFLSCVCDATELSTACETGDGDHATHEERRQQRDDSQRHERLRKRM